MAMSPCAGVGDLPVASVPGNLHYGFKAGMTPVLSAHRAAFGANSSTGESVQHNGSDGASADNMPSESDGIHAEFLARHTTDQFLPAYPWYFTINGALGRHTASAVDPVVSIPADGDFAPTHLQWRSAAQQSVDDAFTRVPPAPKARVVSYSHGHSSVSELIGASEPFIGAGSPAGSLYENCRLLYASLADSGSWPGESHSGTAMPEAATRPLRQSPVDQIYDDDLFSENEAAQRITGWTLRLIHSVTAVVTLVLKH